MLACWPLRGRQTCGYFNIVSNIVNKKMTKNALFLATGYTDYKDCVLDSLVFSANSVLKASPFDYTQGRLYHRDLLSSTRPSKWPFSEAG